MTTNRINFVDKNDAGGLGLGLTEQIPHPAGPHPNKHLDELRRRHREKGNSRFPGNGPSQQGLTGAGGPDQQYTLGDFGADGGKPFWLLQEGDHLLELLLGFGDAGHILKAHRHIALGLQPGLAAAESHGPVGHLGRAADQQGQPPQQQQHQQAVRHQASRGAIGAVIPHRQGNLGCFGRTQQQLVIAEDRNGCLTAIVKPDQNLPLAQGELQVFDPSSAQIAQQLAVGRAWLPWGERAQLERWPVRREAGAHRVETLRSA